MESVRRNIIVLVALMMLNSVFCLLQRGSFPQPVRKHLQMFGEMEDIVVLNARLSQLLHEIERNYETC